MWWYYFSRNFGIYYFNSSNFIKKASVYGSFEISDFTDALVMLFSSFCFLDTELLKTAVENLFFCIFRGDFSLGTEIYELYFLSIFDCLIEKKLYESLILLRGCSYEISCFLNDLASDRSHWVPVCMIASFLLFYVIRDE